MKTIHVLGFTTLLLLANPSYAEEPITLPTPTCAWQFEWTPFGIGNWLWADTANRWWYMPIDPAWEQVTVSGTYPKARFFSIAAYDNAPVSTGLAQHLYDAQIIPDNDGCNPFADPDNCTTLSTYTVTVTRSETYEPNDLRLNAETGWLLYRLYLPSSDGDSMGAVPLPEVSVTVNGQTTTLDTCPISNRRSELTELQTYFVPKAFEYPLGDLTIPPVPDHIWFGVIKAPPPNLLPNPDNKYLASFFMPEYEPGRLIVIRGKMPSFPDTYNGAPISVPPKGFKDVQLRYWGLCQSDVVSPLAVVGCTADAKTPLDGHGFYTIVITNDVLRPDWLSNDKTVWLPWGDEKMVPKLIFMRNLLSSEDFDQSVQKALPPYHECGFDFNFPTPPKQEDITASGQCTQEVMGDYYPLAVWCDREIFIKGGWQACFRAADVPVKP